MKYPMSMIKPARGLLLTAGMLSLALGFFACQEPSSLNANQEARLKNAKDPAKEVPQEETGKACIEVVVCGADGRLYGDPCAAEAAHVKYGYDLSQCGETVDPPEVHIPGIDTPKVVPAKPESLSCGKPGKDPVLPPIIIDPLQNGTAC